jgi:hypothetical protein
MSALKAISVVLGALADVRYYPKSDRLLRCSEVSLCANSDQSAAQQTSGLFDRFVSDGEYP